MISARVVADSISAPTGARLTTFELVLPKWMMAQFNTYGMIRRDSASSRAVPTIKIMEQVRTDPYLPAQWNYRQRGMQPAGPMTADHAALATEIEQSIRRAVLTGVAQLEEIGAAKEDVNRYLEPWMWTMAVATATEWDNYFTQRIHGDAQGPHQTLAQCMRKALDESMPVERPKFDGPHWDADASWHLPYVTDGERQELRAEYLPPLSARRCAAVSYFRQGIAADLDTELSKARDLVRNRHWSPTEMPCLATEDDTFYGPYRGWKPLRKFFGGESGSKHHGTQENDKRWTTW